MIDRSSVGLVRRPSANNVIMFIVNNHKRHNIVLSLCFVGTFTKLLPTFTCNSSVEIIPFPTDIWPFSVENGFPRYLRKNLLAREIPRYRREDSTVRTYPLAPSVRTTFSHEYLQALELGGSHRRLLRCHGQITFGGYSNSWRLRLEPSHGSWSLWELTLGYELGWTDHHMY